ncbi:hypothetical protein AL017_07330 [Enterococcus faecium]|nr:hypothetical protein AL017_07330 [Enterococcus faecium]
MFWKIKKMLVSSTNIKKYRAKKSHYQIFGSGFFGSARVVQNINSRWVRTYVIASLEKVVLVLFELLVRCDNKVSIQ